MGIKKTEESSSEVDRRGPLFISLHAEQLSYKAFKDFKLPAAHHAVKGPYGVRPHRCIPAFPPSASPADITQTQAAAAALVSRHQGGRAQLLGRDFTCP